MPRLVNRNPAYRRKGNSAIVKLWGRVFYLGPYGSKVSKLEYDRLISEWLAAGRPASMPDPSGPDGISVAELCLRFYEHCRAYYGAGKRGEADNFKPVLRLLRETYGKRQAAEIGPRAVKAVIQRVVDGGASRCYANVQLARIKRLFRWGVHEELVEPAVYQAIKEVPGLRKGKTQARETAPVLPVDESIVEKTLPRVSQTIADMVRLQSLSGARPGEVCAVRPCDVDTSGAVWAYIPGSHKTEHRGRQRVIFFGPKAQAVLRPYLLREKTAYCFSPKEVVRRRRATLSEERKTPLSCGNRPGTNRRRSPKRSPHHRYSTATYRQAIHRACDAAGIPRWSPNRLRHTRATDLRKRYGVEAAQAILGHSRCETSQIYAEKDIAKAAEIMLAVG